MSTPPSNAAISIRIFTCEHYLTKIHKTTSKPTFDRQSSRVPVIRIFGSTLEGRICCVHVHDIYPYFYINLPCGLDSVDESFYGYHDDVATYLKIEFFSPLLTKKFSARVQYNEMPRQTNCEIELDCTGDDIIVTSKNSSDATIQNPGLKFIWVDMQSRLKELNNCSKFFDKTTHPVGQESYILEREENFLRDLENILSSQPAYGKETIIPSSRSDDSMTLVHMLSEVNPDRLENLMIENETENDVIETTLLDISMDEKENVVNDSENDNSDDGEVEASVSFNEGNNIASNNRIVENQSQLMEVEYSTDDIVEQSENEDLAPSNNPLNVATLFDHSNDDKDFHLCLSTSSGSLNEDLEEPRNIEASFSEEILFSALAWFSIDGNSAPTRRQVETFFLEKNVNPKCKLSQPEHLNISNFRVRPSNGEQLIEMNTFLFVDGFYINGLDKNLASSVSKERRFNERIFEQSYVLGSSLSNTFGFNSTELDLGRSKGLCSVYSQLHLVTMSVEVLCDSRLNLAPDPKFDRVLAIFYTIYYEEKSFSRNGVIFAHDHTYSDEEIKQMWLHCINEDIQFHSADSEETMLRDLVSTVQQYDPDILVGYEIQSMSLGYLIERATKLDLDLASLISRIPEISGQSRHSNADDWWFMADIHIAGRVTLNLWRLLRHEVSINIYTFENVAYHLLRIRCPKYSNEKLTSWFKNAVTW
uniref:DNA-directed DNA polymerase family B exonuclease domain-containing protein n=1 Tax=Romanomermis culicivorax TaxID=13658 RepID=A0A915HSP9_ROMCU